MKLSNLFLNNSAIFKQALESAMVMKVATDSPQAGGVTIEMNSEEVANKMLQSMSAPYICLTNKGIERAMKRSWSFDFSLVKAKNYDAFKKTIKTSDNIASSADLYLFKVSDKLTLVDAESFKTSTSDSTGKIYLHNDADGTIYNGVESNKHPDFGQVLMLNFSPKTCICDVYYADGKMSSFTDLFKKPTIKEGELQYHGKNLKKKSDMSVATGINRILVTIINRKKKKKKSSGEDLASTSFTRGVLLDKGVLPVLAKRGVIKKFYSFKVDFNRLEEDDYLRRYPQLCKEVANDNAA